MKLQEHGGKFGERFSRIAVGREMILALEDKAGFVKRAAADSLDPGFKRSAPAGCKFAMQFSIDSCMEEQPPVIAQGGSSGVSGDPIGFGPDQQNEGRQIRGVAGERQVFVVRYFQQPPAVDEM